MSADYGTPRWRRPVLAPGILGAIVCLAAIAVIDNDSVFTIVRYVVSIVALIVLWMALQVRRWWVIAPMAPIAVLWNPIVPFVLDRDVWLAPHYVAAMLFVAVAAAVRVRVDDARR